MDTPERARSPSGLIRLRCACGQVLAAAVRMERFDAATDAARLQSSYEIVAAASRADVPALPVRALPFYRNRWTTGFSGFRRQTWLGKDDSGQPVGCYLLVLPDLENPTMGWCELIVAPAWRRSGAGRALLEHCASQARLDGRMRLVGEAIEGSPGNAFAAEVGATGGLTEVLRRLDIDDALPSKLAALRTAASPLADGYSLITWIGASPADTLEDQVLLSAAMADAPRDEGTDHEAWDAERITELERVCLATGQQFYSVAARHEATGRLVAITQMSVESGTPEWGFQMITAVLPAHRGHRLGLLIKAEMLDLLAAHEPAVRHILTGNAASNDHMVAINEQLGFTVACAFRNWEFDLANQ
jgi:GNAT superfamily N-acetyltransferase